MDRRHIVMTWARSVEYFCSYKYTSRWLWFELHFQFWSESNSVFNGLYLLLETQWHTGRTFKTMLSDNQWQGFAFPLTKQTHTHSTRNRVFFPYYSVDISYWPAWSQTQTLVPQNQIVNMHDLFTPTFTILMMSKRWKYNLQFLIANEQWSSAWDWILLHNLQEITIYNF